MSSLVTAAKRALKYMDPTFLRNRAMYLLAENPPLDDIGPQGDDATTLDQRPLPKRWDVSQVKSGTVTSCPEVSGLFLHRNFLNASDLLKVERFVAVASEQHQWFTYHKGREMLPVNSLQRKQDLPRSADLHDLLLSLQSTNNTNPDTWPDLESWCQHDNSGAAAGAKVLVRVQQKIQENNALLPKAVDEPCLFVQIQNVIRGGVVGSHVDPLVKGGKAIATLIINGVTDVRVGDTLLRVEPGDMYGLEGHARYNIEHEVLPTVDDRLTATFRFGHDDVETREKFNTV